MDNKYHDSLNAVLELCIDSKSDTTKQVRTINLPQLFQNKVGDKKSQFKEGFVNDLETMGLLSHNGHKNFYDRQYFITNKGLQVLKEGGVSTYVKKLANKEALEKTVLEATAASHKLNKIQMWVTIILAAGTLIGVIFQCQSYNRDSEKIKLEIEKLKIELENKQIRPSNPADSTIGRR